jgi:hypothetical protein
MDSIPQEQDLVDSSCKPLPAMTATPNPTSIVQQYMRERSAVFKELADVRQKVRYLALNHGSSLDR